MNTKLFAGLFSVVLQLPAAEDDDAARFASLFDGQVDRKLLMPQESREKYAGLLFTELKKALTQLPASQFVVLVDRNPNVQALMIYWISPAGDFQFIGASPVSTGKPGRYEYFETPLGVFDHVTDHPDYRALGTRNEHGIRGNGVKGMRIYDFGWVKAPRGWGDRHEGSLRFQIHATDPELFEPKLGTVGSKGCVRVAATLNAFLDRNAILDANYEKDMREGKSFYVMQPTREPGTWSGRYLVVIDSQATARPEWSPLPKLDVRSGKHLPVLVARD